MRRVVTGLALVCVLAAALTGCARSDEKPIITLVDEQGIAETRVVTVGYVNERLTHIPPAMLPGGEDDEAKLAFLNEIVRKELLVIAAYRLGIDKDPRIATALEHFRSTNAENMLRDDVITEPSQVTSAEVEKYYEVRDAMFQLREIVVQDEETANEVYRRVTDGGEGFGAVAGEVSTSGSSSDGGRREVQNWQDLHPLIKVGIKDAVIGDIVGPIKVSETYYIFEVLSRKDPATRTPLEGRHLRGITAECRAFKRDLLEHEVVENWMAEANITYNYEAVDIAGARIDEKVFELIPPYEGEMTSEIAIQRAKTKIVPDFSKEEVTMELVTFRIGGEEHVWTLGDYAAVLDEKTGMETPKKGSELHVKDSVQKRVFIMIKDHEVEKRGYHTSREMEDYLAARHEEALVDLAYDAEVTQKMEVTSGQEIRDYFRSHREDFVRAPRANVRQLIVGEEAQANNIRQQIVEGGADFIDMVKKHSIDSWSQSRDGLIVDVMQGEGRLAHLQEPAFSLEIGEVSKPVRAAGGYALVVVLERYPEEQLTFDEVGSTVVNHLEASRREARLVEFIDEVKTTVDVHVHEENLNLITDMEEVRSQMELRRVTAGG